MNTESFAEFTKTDFYNNCDFIPNFSQKVTNLTDWHFLANKWDEWKAATEVPPVTVPKIIHQVWIGSILPEKYREWTQSWQQKGYEYHLWDEASLLAIFTEQEKAWYNATASFGPKSDIARYKVLSLYGGIYCDTDFECLKPFDDILAKTTLFAGVIFDAKPEIAGGIVGAIPHHPLIEKTLSLLIEKTHTESDYNDILYSTGPAFFTRAIFANRDLLYTTDVFFPTHYLYPLPNFTAMNTLSPKKIRTRYIKPVSYAIHYWEISWDKTEGAAIRFIKKLVKKVIFYEHWKHTT